MAAPIGRKLKSFRFYSIVLNKLSLINRSYSVRKTVKELLSLTPSRDGVIVSTNVRNVFFLYLRAVNNLFSMLKKVAGISKELA